MALLASILAVLALAGAAGGWAAGAWVRSGTLRARTADTSGDVLRRGWALLILARPFAFGAINDAGDASGEGQSCRLPRFPGAGDGGDVGGDVSRAGFPGCPRVMPLCRSKC